MATYNPKFAKWLKDTGNPFFSQYEDLFKSGEDAFSMLGKSFSNKNITTKDVVAKFQSELPLESTDLKQQQSFVALETPINSHFIGNMVRAADYGAVVEKECPRYNDLKLELARAYKVKIVEAPSISGVISYGIRNFIARLKQRKYNRILKRAANAAVKGKKFSIGKLDLHSLSKKIKIDNDFILSDGAKYVIGDNEKLLNVVNAFAKNLTNVFFNHDGLHFISAATDDKIKFATELFSTLYVSRAMNWGDITINKQIEDSLKVQIAQTLSSIKGEQSNDALKKIREETIEVTKYMMSRQELTLADIVENSKKMGRTFAVEPKTLEEAMFGSQNFGEMKKPEEKPEEKAEEKEEKKEKKAEEKAEEKKEPKSKPGVVLVKKMDLIRELSKQIDESLDSKGGSFYNEDELLDGNAAWYFNAYQSVINKTPNSTYEKINKLSDLKTNKEIVEIRKKMLESLASSVVQVGKSKTIDFTEKQLAELQGEWIANQMVDVVEKSYTNPIEIYFDTLIKKNKSTETAYNKMMSEACESAFEQITGKNIKEWIGSVVNVKKEDIISRETAAIPKTIRKIKKEGFILAE